LNGSRKLNANLSKTRHLTRESAKGFSYLFQGEIATFAWDRVCIGMNGAQREAARAKLPRLVSRFG
jgi:hypothetical protein